VVKYDKIYMCVILETHVVGMIEIFTAIVTHTVILESFGFNN